MLTALFVTNAQFCGNSVPILTSVWQQLETGSEADERVINHQVVRPLKESYFQTFLRDLKYRILCIAYLFQEFWSFACRIGECRSV
jgi:hypothetical protein